MADMQWTTSQNEAIRATGVSILVSAGAGSGKTAVLAERCAHLVADADPPCPVDRLLVVTFTDAAATQMRQRIADALQKRLTAAPRNARLRHQLALLDTAWISTIHSFCRRVLSRHFSQADIDPLAPVMEPNDAQLLRQETARRVFNEFAERDDAAGEAFHALSAHYGGPSEDQLIDIVLAVDAFLASIPDPQAWVAACLQRFSEKDADPLPLFWLAQLTDALRAELTQQRNVVAAHLAALHRAPAVVSPSIECLATYQQALDDWLLPLNRAANAGAIDRICRGSIAVYAFPKPPTVMKKQLAALRDDEARAFVASVEVVRNVRDRFAKRIQKTYGRFSTADWADGIARTRAHIRAFLALVTEVHALYQKAKRDLGVVDFPDLERFTLDLLQNESSGVAEQLRDKFNHVLVDEFQDVNQVQAEILRLVSREPRVPSSSNLFAVGDVKQCIYRFRLAEPRLFLARRDAFARPSSHSSPTASDAPADGSGLLIDLVENFRSERPILDAINALFERLMAPDLGGIAYDEHARLKPGRTDTATSAGPAVELHLLDKVTGGDLDEGESDEENATPSSSAFDWEQIEREAFVVADRIKALRSQGTPYRDMVVLLRTFQVHAALFVRTLSRLGVPVFADVSGGLFQAIEVHDVLALLTLLDNAQQDIPLAAVLRSPLFGDALTDSHLAEIAVAGRGARPPRPFHAAVRHYAADGADPSLRARLAAIFERLARWRQRIRRRPLADVLWEIYEESGYLAYVSGLREGRHRQANLLQLHEYARGFDSFKRQGLHRFLAFVDGVRASGQDLEAGSVASPSADVVRLMTIHRSKGLEFPVVILADLGKQFNLTDARSSILFDRRLGVAFEAVDLDRRIRYPTLPHQLVAQAATAESLAEEMRVLYVALTRARRKLILVGTASLAALQADRERYAGQVGPLPLLDRQTAGNMLVWLRRAVCCQPAETVALSDSSASCAAPLFAVHTYDAARMKPWVIEPAYPAGVLDRLRRATAAAPLPSSADDPLSKILVQRVARRLTTPYPAASLTTVPAVAAASVLKRCWDTRQDPENPTVPWSAAADELAGPKPPPRAFRRPDFLDRARPSDPAALGTLTHEFLQRLDLSRPCDEVDLRAQMQTLVGTGVFPPAAAATVNLAGVAWFFQTPPGRRLLNRQTRILREWPFVLGVDPRRHDPAAMAPGPHDLMLVRGIIDCLFDAGDGWEVLDYKTDAVTGEQLALRAAEYRGQLRIYAAAVEATWSRKVTRCWLVFLSARQILEV